MNVALKEWAVVVEALRTGRQIMLLRKGGIVEARRGFELRHPEFLFFPTLEHQHVDFLKPEARELYVRAAARAEPERLVIDTLAKVSDVLAAPESIDAMQSAADRLHIWNEAYLRQRYEYRPDLPLYLILLRVYRLASPQLIPVRPSYAGCKSWVNLTEEINIAGAEPVLDDEAFETARRAAADLR